MLQDKDSNLRIEEINVPVDSQANGKKLGDLDFWSKAGLFPIAILDISGNWIYNPTPHATLAAGSTIVIIGNYEQRQIVESILA
jgi:K+/H+ antiporter YhaU regulatory subunit KhtT